MAAPLCFKAYRLSQPYYSSDILQPYNTARALRSSSYELLSQPLVKTKLAQFLSPWLEFGINCLYPFVLQTVLLLLNPV
jgi:hypothetical protein